MGSYKLRVLWDDDALTVLDFPSKDAAIDWLATHADRPMASASIIPVPDMGEPKCICRIRGVADLTCPVHGVGGTAPFSEGQE
jgi:hypothetical protein